MSNTTTKAVAGQAWSIDTTTGVNMRTVYLIEDESGDFIARVNILEHARLIAEAPAMLAALEACAARLGEMDCGPELDQARSAIEAAKGRTHS